MPEKSVEVKKRSGFADVSVSSGPVHHHTSGWPGPDRV